MCMVDEVACVNVGFNFTSYVLYYYAGGCSVFSLKVIGSKGLRITYVCSLSSCLTSHIISIRSKKQYDKPSHLTPRSWPATTTVVARQNLEILADKRQDL